VTALEQVVISSEHLHIVVLPGVGARLHELTVRGEQLLKTPPVVEEHRRDPFFWGAYVMAPWCNRVEPGPAEVLGETVDLVPNFKDGSAIHGQAYATAWEQTSDTSFALDHGGDGWPWPYRVEIDYLVEGLHLTVRQRLVNRASSPMPGGLGLHPWLTGNPPLTIRAASAYPTNIDPPAVPLPVNGDLDMRQVRTLTLGLDATWVDLDDPAVVIAFPGIGVRAILRSESPTLHIVAANPDDRDAVAVEPQTHAPQGLRRLVRGEPGAMAVIQPGQSLELATEISFETMSS
jgi:aldose 1-epimerase